MRRHSIKDVAQRAGVSVGTVSNVLNNPERVAQGTRERVNAAIDELGFVRSGAARQLRAGISRTVGAVILDVSNPFFTEVARGIEDRLAEDHRILILCSTDEDPDREQRYLRALEEQGVQGVLVTPALRDTTHLEALRRRGTSVVLLDRRSTKGEMCSVAVDDIKGGELAAAHLIEMGHRRIGFVNGPTSIRQCADRRRGVRRALKAGGVDPEDLVEITVESLNAEGGERAVTELMALRRRPTAILCANDLMALGVMRTLRASGLSIPDDIAVVGYDDVEFAAMLSTPLTSVRQPKYQLGHAAADLLLLERSEPRGHRHRQVLFQPELVVRQSSSKRVRKRR